MQSRSQGVRIRKYIHTHSTRERLRENILWKKSWAIKCNGAKFDIISYACVRLLRKKSCGGWSGVVIRASLNHENMYIRHIHTRDDTAAIILGGSWALAAAGFTFITAYILSHFFSFIPKSVLHIFFDSSRCVFFSRIQFSHLLDIDRSLSSLNRKKDNIIFLITWWRLPYGRMDRSFPPSARARGRFWWPHCLGQHCGTGREGQPGRCAHRTRWRRQESEKRNGDKRSHKQLETIAITERHFYLAL